MGRRKQANPLKVSPDGKVTVVETSPSTVNSPPESPLSPKRSKLDFSIAAQLESVSNKPSTSTDLRSSSHTLQNALKAYETLLTELNNKPNGIKPGPLLRLTKQVDQLVSRDGKRDPATESALDLRVKRANRLPSTFRTPTSSSTKSTTTLTSDDDSLRKLSSLVGQAGSTMSAHMAAVVKSAPHDIKDDNDPRTVFTCLQCYQRYGSMQELTDHMRKTQHLSQQLTSGKLPFCNWNGTTTNGASTSAVSTDVKVSGTTKPSTSTHNSSSRACSYRYRCSLCGFCSDTSIEEHMRSLHGFKVPAEWITVVKLIPI